MNLKYYLRGLGIGIVVAAILMGVATRGNESMTDAEIKERAAQLGMVEQKVLADISNERTTTEVPATPEPDVTLQEAPTEAPQGETTVAPQEEPTEAPQSEVTTEPQTPRQEGDAETIFLTISRGESSWTVSKKLVELGLVEDAAAFDRFLSQGGYDKSINIGDFEIAKDATYEEIAEIITN